MRLLWANDKMRQPELTCLLPTLCQRKKVEEETDVHYEDETYY